LINNFEEDKMAETKYGKYILREPHVSTWPREPISVNSTLNEGITCDIVFTVRSEPGTEGPQPHKHDADEYIFFLGGDPTNYKDFQAEIDFCLGWGEDQETFTINTATIVYIPKGLVHLPWNFKRVDKPIIVGHILLAPEFSKTNAE
jgi:mannose-6-phosphate isomerase-like protein (cupin superfamily)